MFIYLVAIAMLAFASAAADCTQPPTSFQIYANITGTTGQYAYIESNCGYLNCFILFYQNATTATTYYTITNSGNLVIAPETMASGVAGNVAYIATPQPNQDQQFVYFGRMSAIKKSTDPTLETLRCSIVDSPDGDGTCDLSCSRPHFHPGDYVWRANFNEWSLGRDGKHYEKIQVKVAF